MSSFDPPPDPRDEWPPRIVDVGLVERIKNRRRDLRRQSRSRKVRGCLGKLLFVLMLMLGVACWLYTEFRESDRLPDWVRKLPLPGLPAGGRESPSGSGKGGAPVWIDPSDWEGHALADRSHQSPNFRRVRSRVIDRVVLHSTESSSAQSAIGHFQNRVSQVSAHYIVDRDGTVYQMVDERNQAWHCRGANQSTVGVEIVSLQGERITTRQTQAIVVLLTDLRERLGISRRRITGHRFTPGYLGNTSCPNQLFGGNEPRHLERWLRENLDPVWGR